MREVISRRGFFIAYLTIATLLCAIAWNSWPQRLALSDGVAQFFPWTLEGYRQIKLYEFPLFNYYQFLGHPLLQLGYYPVLYPLTWLAFFIAEVLFSNIQYGWDVLGFLQLVLNGAALFVLCRTSLRIAPPLALVAAISGAFLGSAVYFCGEWFYVTSAIGFTALLIYLLERLINAPSIRRGFILGSASALFLFASNVQLVFYAFHFVAIAGIGIFLRQRISYLRNLQYRGRLHCGIAMSALASALLLVPYLYAIFEHSAQSIREKSKVPLETYFWNTNSVSRTLINSWWPYGGREDIFWKSPGLYYIGLVPCIGFILTPLALTYLQKSTRRGKHDLPLAIAFLFGTLFAFLMSLGPDGLLPSLFYHLPVYSWFRHSIKWLPFFHLFLLISGVFFLDRLIRIFKQQFSKFAGQILAYSALLITLLVTFRFVLVFENPPRFTTVTLPIELPSLAADPHYRHIGVWDAGFLFPTTLPGQIGGHNYATIWELPTVAGYEPMIAASRFNALHGHWSPGFYTGVKNLDLNDFIKLGVRYIRVPNDSADATLAVFQKNFPDVGVRRLGYDSRLDVTVLEIAASKPLVRGLDDNLIVKDFHITGRSIDTTVNAHKSGSLLFNWHYSPHFKAYEESGETLPIRKDRAGRVVIPKLESGEHHITLRYEPTVLLWLFRSCYLTWIIVAITILGITLYPLSNKHQMPL